MCWVPTSPWSLSADKTEHEDWSRKLWSAFVSERARTHSCARGRCGLGIGVQSACLLWWQGRQWKDQALTLWSGSTDSKTLHYQRTNPREYQIVRTHTKETTWIQDLASLKDQQQPVQDDSSKQQTKQKYKPSHQQTGLPPHSALPIRGKTNKQKLSTNLTL